MARKHWFIGDQHFYHTNIIRFCKRPYSNAKVMNTDLIARHNAVVGKDDYVWHLGDVMYWKGYTDPAKYGSSKTKLLHIMQRLNGKHELILGNHDSFTPRDYVAVGFTAVHTSLTIDVQGNSIFLNHDPCVGSGIPKNKIFICGHTHGLFKTMLNENKNCAPCINVSVENWEYTPVSFDQIIGELEG